MSKNPYDPPNAPVEPPKQAVFKPAPTKAEAYLLMGAGVIIMMIGAHFDDPARAAGLSVNLRLMAVCAHIGGAILLIIGGVRMYRANRRG